MSDPSEDPPDGAVPRGGAPDVFTLEAWLRAEAAMEAGQPVDATVSFLQDRVTDAFGRNALHRSTDFLEANGLQDARTADLAGDEAQLRALRAHLLADDDAPDVPEPMYAWVAWERGEGLQRLRRAARTRRRSTALSYLLPRRRRVAGRRPWRAERPARRSPEDG